MNIYEKAFNELLKEYNSKDEYYQQLKNNRKHKSVRDFLLKHSPKNWIINAFPWQGSQYDPLSIRVQRHARWDRLNALWRKKLSILAKRDDQRAI